MAPDGWVAASVGPYGAVLADGSEYRGDYDLDVAGLRAFHRPRLDVLASTVGAGADVLAVETIPCLAEVEAVLAEIDGSGMPAWLSLSAADGRTRAGEPLRGGVRDGGRRGGGARRRGQLHGALRRAATPSRSAGAARPVVVYPNSGQAWNAETREWRGVGLPPPRTSRRGWPTAPGWSAAAAVSAPRTCGRCARRSEPEHGIRHDVAARPRMAYTWGVPEPTGDVSDLLTSVSSVPILDAMGIRLVESGPGRAVAELPAEPNVNHFGVTYAGSLLQRRGDARRRAELATFDLDGELAGFVPLVKESTIRFRRPALGVVRASRRPVRRRGGAGAPRRAGDRQGGVRPRGDDHRCAGRGRRDDGRHLPGPAVLMVGHLCGAAGCT